MLLILISMKDRTIFPYNITRRFSHLNIYELFANIKLYSLFKGRVITFKIKVTDGLISSYFSHGKLEVSSLLFVYLSSVLSSVEGYFWRCLKQMNHPGDTGLAPRQLKRYRCLRLMANTRWDEFHTIWLKMEGKHKQLEQLFTYFLWKRLLFLYSHNIGNGHNIVTPYF